MNATAPTLLDLTPPPGEVRARMGELYRELRLLRRLERVSRQAREGEARAPRSADGKAVANAL